ncbi:EpsG family protein [Pedobacter sp.]|uniref:EpsG family protein n=1 Tax=Pedobacter sp. TaxID=1411316 RepID=UPI003D7FABC7
MVAYVALYIYLIVVSIITWKKENNTIFFLSALLVALLPALRAVSVGTDTINYVNYFLYPSRGYNDQLIEFGYEVWNDIIRFIWYNEYFFLFSSSLLAMSGVIFFIYKESPYRTFSLLLFVIVEQFYFMEFSGMRQVIAISFFLFALYYYHANTPDKKKAFLFFVLAMLFHATVAWTLPFILFLDKVSFKKKWVYILLVLSFIAGLYGVFDYRSAIATIFGMVNVGDGLVNKYGGYSDFTVENESNSHRILWDMLPLSVICLGIVISQKQIDYHYLKLFITGVVVNNLIISYPIGFRIVIYLLILIVIIVPKAFNRQGLLAAIIYTLIVVYYLYKSCSILLVQFNPLFVGNKVVPYKTYLDEK